MVRVPGWLGRGFGVLLSVFVLAGCTFPPEAYDPPAGSTAVPRLAGGAGIGDTYYPTLGNSGYDVRHYSIILDVKPERNTVNGVAVIEAVAQTELAAFNLDFAGLTIDRITVSGGAGEPAEAEYARRDGELTIFPPEQLPQGQPFTVAVTYHGEPEPAAAVTSVAVLPELGWTAAPSGAINVFSEPNGASSWYPVNDHPRDKATYRFEITVPKPWVVAANGRLLETVDEGEETRYTWEMDRAMASYLATVNVDTYDVVTGETTDGILVRNYFPKAYPASLRDNFEVLPYMLAYFEKLYGPYPFGEYGVVIAADDNPVCAASASALETQTLALHCPLPFMAEEFVIAHELAHQWFGDSVSLENWQDLWLKEGAATYAEYLWEARSEGLRGVNRRIADALEGYEPQVPVAEPPADSLYLQETYLGGALVFHALRLQVGDDTFFAILRTFLERYRDGYAGTDEFIAVAQEVSGKDLRQQFDAWLYEVGVPEMTLN